MACVPDTKKAVETTDPAPAELSDDQLMARVTRRDQEAFACLLDRHLNAVHGYLYRLTGSRADADDLSQDTFLRVWRKAGTFKPGRVKLTTWLHRIAHNLCVDEFRKRRNDSHIETNPDELCADGAAQITQLEVRENVERLHIVLQGLPENQRCALVLCQIQGFSNLEAAKILGINVRALESLLARARRRLKAELADYPLP